MPAIRTQISVTKCVECPFFERNVGHFIVEHFLTKSPTRGGTCRYNGLGQAFPLGRIHVSDEAAIPEGCPLKGGDCLIMLEPRA